MYSNSAAYTNFLLELLYSSVMYQEYLKASRISIKRRFSFQNKWRHQKLLF